MEMGEQLYLEPWNITYNVKYCDLKHFLKAQFIVFRCQKYVKKGYIEMGEQLYLEPLKSVPGHSVFH